MPDSSGVTELPCSASGNRPAELSSEDKPTPSQMIAQAMMTKAVTSGKVSADEVAQLVYDGIEAGRFYIYTHPKTLRMVQTRLEDVHRRLCASDSGRTA